jgi:hypothetical protein
MPESLAHSATADALHAIVNLDLSELEIEPPKGLTLEAERLPEIDRCAAGCHSPP